LLKYRLSKNAPEIRGAIEQNIVGHMTPTVVLSGQNIYAS
jgi:hypothetical protein